jgi:NMD protein affecting ribosome stability and mRNA decay
LQSIIDKCRICGTEEETIEHLISSYTVLVQSEYKKRHDIQGVPELAPQRKQACADNKRDSKLTKINFLLAQITELQSF